MSTASIEQTRDRIDASGASCEVVAREALGVAIEDATVPPAIATPTDPFPEVLASTEIVVDPTGAEIQAAATGITCASAAVTESGSIAVDAGQAGASLVSVFVDRHVAVVPESRIVSGIDDLLTGTGETVGTSWILATGPSATADMGALVEGAHGPGEVHVILVREDGT